MSKAKLLVVEDDPNLGEILQEYLQMKGYDTTLCRDGEEGWNKFKKDKFDLCLLDVMMPKKDGFTLAKEIKKVQEDQPVLFLTAKNQKEDVIDGLKIGADDYLTKPFAPKELSARIRALLRRVRPSAPGHSKLVFGNLEIIPDEGKVTLGGKDVPLTKTEFRLLCELAHDPNGVFSREVLLDKVWGHGYFGDGRLVDVHIRRLRMKVEVDPAEPTHVVTVRGLGYRLQS